jgi:hypothetical protein
VLVAGVVVAGATGATGIPASTAPGRPIPID